MSSFSKDMFSKHQWAFRKGFSTQQCLLKLFEKWKNTVNKGKILGALLADLSHLSNCLNHELIIVNLKAQSFILPTLKLIQTTYQTEHCAQNEAFY